MDHIINAQPLLNQLVAAQLTNAVYSRMILAHLKGETDLKFEDAVKECLEDFVAHVGFMEAMEKGASEREPQE